MFFGAAWIIRRYRWCAECGQKHADDPKSTLCPSCRADLEVALERLLSEGSS